MPSPRTDTPGKKERREREAAPPPLAPGHIDAGAVAESAAVFSPMRREWGSEISTPNTISSRINSDI
uniref:Uncharacterized protein n=1 Tax=Oryza nivara TaxID=4536 RepID=A0A0E0FI01_ORYNI